MALKFLNNGYFAGKVGIGTESPGRKLEVDFTGSVYGAKFTRSDAAGSSLIEFANSAGVKSIIGYDAGVDGYKIGTASATNLVVKQSGNVGIGTTTPTAPLHIEGGTNSEVLKIEADANPYIRWVENGTNVGFLQFLGDNAYLSNMANGSLFFRTNNTDKMTILPGGNVGIGTTSPSANLDILNGVTGASLKLSATTSAYWQLQRDSTTGNLNISDDGIGNVMSLDQSNGNVGIGTTNPGQDLEISGEGNAAIRITSTNSTTSTLQFADSDDGNIGLIQYAHNNDYMLFRTNGGERMRIASSGNVGIGTTSPAIKLDINSGTANSALRVLSTDRYTGIKFEDSLDNDTLFYDGQSNLMYLSSTNFRAVDLHATGNLRVDGAIYDSNNSPGTANQVLVSTVTGTDWVDGSAIPGVPAGSGTLNTIPLWTPDGDTLGNSIITQPNTGVVRVSGNSVYFSVTDTSAAARNIDIGHWVSGQTNIESQGGTLSIGTQSNHNIVFETNGSTKATILSGGNVGIGTTSPLSKLQVGLSTSNAGSTLAMLGAAESGILSALSLVNTLGNSAAGYGTALDFHVNAAYSPTGRIATIAESTATPAALAFYTYNSGLNEKMRITSAGNVGIGLTNPADRLDLYDSDDNVGMYFHTATSGTGVGNGLRVGQNNANAFVWNYEATPLSLATGGTARLTINATGGIRFNTGYGAGTLVTDASGNVTVSSGGGAGGPYLPLSAGQSYPLTGTLYGTSTNFSGNGDYAGSMTLGTGASTAEASLTIGQGRTDSGYSYIDLVGGTTYSDYGLRIIRGNTGSNADSLIIHRGQGNLNIQTTDSASILLKTAGNEKMRITSTGNVGIGVTGPNAKLEVSYTNTGIGAIVGNTTHNSQLQIYTAAAGKNSEIWFGDASDADVGKIDYDHANDSMSFFIGATKRLSFDSAGTMLLGDTTTAYQTIFFDPTPSTVYGNGTLQIQPTTSPGSGIAQFTTNFADRVGGGTTKHNVRVGGTVTATDFIGGSGAYLPLAGGTMTGTNGVVFPDNFILNIGTANDLTIKHNATDSFIENHTGHLSVVNYSNDKDIIFWSDDGTGGIAKYLVIDGANEVNQFYKDASFYDGIRANFGNSNDLQIYHDGSNSYIKDTGTGSIIINTDFFRILNSAGNSQMFRCDANDSVQLYYNNSVKLVTTNTGVTLTGAATATTFLGDLNGTINTATTGVTQVNAINNTTIATTAYVNNKIALIPAGLVFQGTWNAATNTPTLTSGSGTTGNFYIVSVAGSTNLDGITDWKVGDWAVFIEQGQNDQWEKIDNSSVLDGIGTGQSVTKWDGSGTSNTLTDGPITFSGNDSTFAGAGTFAGNVTVGNNTTNVDLYLKGGTNSNTAINFGDPSDNNVGQIIYRHANNSMSFDTSDTEKMRIEASGNVGIGTTSPAAGLQVAKGGSTIPAAGSSTASAVFGNSTSDNNYGVAIGANSSGVGYISSQRTDGAATTYNLAIQPNGGNVGIGITGPTDKLTVNGNLSIFGNKIYNGSASNSAGVSFPSSTTRIDGYNGITFHSSQTTVGSQTERMRITNAGNVGIGTTSPGAKLNVVGTGTQLGTSGYYYNTFLKDTTNSGVLLGGNNTDNGVGFLAGVNELAFLTFGTSWGERMRIASTGNVGIGTTIPAQNFVVADATNGNGVELVPGTTATIQTYNRGTSAYTNLNIDTLETRVRSIGTTIFNNGSGFSESMRITSAGNVGIGTTSPLGRLQVNEYTVASQGNQSMHGEVSVFANDGDESLFLGLKDSAYPNRGWAINPVAYGINSSLQIKEHGSTAVRMTIQSGGNVGIGQPTPLNSLDVYRATGDASIRIQANTAADSTILKFRNSNADADITVDYTASNLARMVFTTDNSGGYVPVLSLEANRDTLMYGNVGIGTTTPNYKLTVSGGINAGGVVTYSKVAGSLNTTGYAIAGLGTVFNGASAFFTFTASGGTGQYQRVVYSCAGVGTNWVVYKVIDEGTNVLDIEASATSAATIVFTFKTRSGTQAYSPRVVIQASGHSIISTYA